MPFIEIARPLVRMVEEGLLSPEHPVDIKITGDAGKLPATIATPLSVVLNELLQNVVDHAYPDEVDGDGGHVLLELDNDGAELRVRVTDDGAGLPDGFSLDTSTGLGLSIVRTLVTTELDGTIELVAGPGDGDRPGTTVDVRVPLGPVVEVVEAVGPAGTGPAEDSPDAPRPSDAEGR